MCQQFQTDIYFLIQRPISPFLTKYYGHKGGTQILLIKDINASDMIIQTLSPSGPSCSIYQHTCLAHIMTTLKIRVTTITNNARLCGKYYTGISHKASSTTRTSDFFSNWKYTPLVSGASKAIYSRVQQFEEMG